MNNYAKKQGSVGKIFPVIRCAIAIDPDFCFHSYNLMQLSFWVKSEALGQLASNTANLYVLSNMFNVLV